MDASSQSRQTTTDMLVKTSTVLVLQNHVTPKFKGFSIFLVKVLKLCFYSAIILIAIPLISCGFSQFDYVHSNIVILLNSKL